MAQLGLSQTSPATEGGAEDYVRRYDGRPQSHQRYVRVIFRGGHERLSAVALRISVGNLGCGS